MKRYLILSFLLLAGAFAGKAHAQSELAFPTMPSQMGGAGSPAKFGVTEGGVKWVAWTYANDTRFAMVCRAMDHEPYMPETSQLKTPIAVARAYWKANVFADCSTDPYFRPAYRAARAAFGLK